MRCLRQTSGIDESEAASVAVAASSLPNVDPLAVLQTSNEMASFQKAKVSIDRTRSAEHSQDH